MINLKSVIACYKSYNWARDSELAKNSDFQEYLGNRILEDFEYEDDINTYCSCSLMLRGSMMLFGGFGNYSRQLLSIGNCSLKLEGQLPFDFQTGACETFDQSQTGESALLCFSETSSPYKDCYT